VLTGGLVIVLSVPFGLAMFGVLGVTLLIASPIAACWWCATADELRPPDTGSTGR
jgi:hypothetical protein